MDDIHKFIEKYDFEHVRARLHCVKKNELNEFALTFAKDVADVYDCITRIRNLERNSTGFSLDHAPVLGLLVRVWKLLK